MKLSLFLTLFVSITSTAFGQATRPSAPATKPAAKVVFLLDSSGSMISSLRPAKNEIIRGVAELATGSSFGIVANGDLGKSASAFKKTLSPASPAASGLAAKYLDNLAPTGMDGEFSQALTLIAAMKPDVVWFCTDGSYSPEPAKSIAALEAAAKKGKFRLNVVYFAESGQSQAALAAVAEATGGVCLTQNGEKYAPKATVAAKPAPAPPAKPKKDGPSIFREN